MAATATRNIDLTRYFTSALTVDNVIFGFDDGDLKVLLIKRNEEPYSGRWGLPGYFVLEHEDLDTAAQRVLREMTGLEDVFLEQVRTFGATDRHPVGRVVTVAYYSLIKIGAYQFNSASKVVQTARWHVVQPNMNLAFDHDEILNACLQQLKRQVRTRPIGFELLPKKFTLTQLQHLYEAILENKLDKRNFRKKILSMKLLVDLDETQAGVAHRPAKLYRFDRKRYQKALDKGFNFEL